VRRQRKATPPCTSACTPSTPARLSLAHGPLKHPLPAHGLQLFDLYTDRLWIWAAVGYLLATYFVLTGLSALVLHFAQPPRIAPQVSCHLFSFLRCCAASLGVCGLAEHVGRTRGYQYLYGLTQESLTVSGMNQNVHVRSVAAEACIRCSACFCSPQERSSHDCSSVRKP
jgi:hypothetical protein